MNINGVETNALLDTGSVVSLISQSFYNTNLNNIPLQPLEDILYIECASGTLIPYKGYIEVEIETFGVPQIDKQIALFLVSPDTDFSSTTPVLIGTNVLNEVKQKCKDRYGERYLQLAKLTSPWYTSFRTMVIQERHLKKNNNRIGEVRSASPYKISIQPNNTINLKGYIDKKLHHLPTTAIM